MERHVSVSGLGFGLFASASPIVDALACNIPVFEIVPDDCGWCVTCTDQHCGGRFADRAAALKFAREEAERCDAALIRGKDGEGRVTDLIAVEHPRDA